MPDLTDKQQRFVQEYLVDLNATAAARRAGYSEKTAEVQGPRLLGNVRVAQAITEAKGKLAERHQVTLDMVIAEYVKIGFADIRKTMKWGETVMVPCSPEVAEAFIKTDGSEADFPEDDIDEDLEGQPHGGGLKRKRRSSPQNAVAVRAHTPLALIASDQIDDSTAAAISEVRQTKEGLSLKMHSKTEALAKLYAHLAPEKAAQQAAVTVNVDKMQLNLDVTQVTAEVDELLHEFLNPSGEPPLNS